MAKTNVHVPMPEGAEKLTPKQEAFCNEYLLDRNATAAAVRAGYSEKSAQNISSILLTKPHVAKRLQELMDERAQRTRITADYILETIRDTVERCRQAEPVKEWDPVAKEMVETGEWKFEYQGVLKGCELLGKHLRLFTDRLEIEDKTSLAEKMAEARRRMGKA